MIRNLRDLCNEAGGKMVGSSIRGAPPGSVDACEVTHARTGETKEIFESDIEGGNFMFGSPDSGEVLISDVDRVRDGQHDTTFFLPDSGSYVVSTDF